LGQKDCSLSLQVLEKIIDKGKDIKQLSKDITEHFRHLMIIKVGGKSLGRLVDYPVAIKEMLLTQCQQFTLKEILTAIDMFIESQETARITESVRMPLEVAFAKLTYQDQAGRVSGEVSTQRPAPSPGRTASRARPLTPAVVLRDKKGQVGISGSGASPEDINEETPELEEDIAGDMDKLVAQELGHVEEPGPVALDLAHIKKVWDVLTHEVSREKMSVATYLQEGAPFEVDQITLTIAFPQRCRFQKEALEDSPNVQLVERVFSVVLKTTVIVRYTVVEEFAPQEESEIVQDALKTFEGKVISRWHEDK
jgi:DNA polymerase-3 subunit gamma/tau